MRVLITGGAGLIGSCTAEYYAKKGNEGVVLDTSMRSQFFDSGEKSVESNLKWLRRYSNIRYVEGDVRNEMDVKNALGDGVDAVIHTAGQPGIQFSIRFPLKDFSVNALGTLNVLECTRQVCPGAAFIFCSTNKVYGENVNKIIINKLETRYAYFCSEGVSESTPIDQAGHTPYGASKYVGDLYTQEYAHIYGMKTAVFRMSCVYGARQHGFEDQGWIAWFITSMLKGNSITIYGDGKQVRDILYVDDVVKAYDAFIRSNIQHNVWNIGGGLENSTSLIELIKFLEGELSVQASLISEDWRPFDQKVYISDISKVCRDLHWQPEISVEAGCRKLIEGGSR